MSREAIHSDKAPAAIGTYSQSIKAGNLVFLSGQIPLDPATMEVVSGDFEARARRVFDNLSAVIDAVGGDLNQVVKLTIFLTDLDNFATVNSVMEDYFDAPYPARGSATRGSGLALPHFDNWTQPNLALTVGFAWHGRGQLPGIRPTSRFA